MWSNKQISSLKDALNSPLFRSAILMRNMMSLRLRCHPLSRLQSLSPNIPERSSVVVPLSKLDVCWVERYIDLHSESICKGSGRNAKYGHKEPPLILNFSAHTTLTVLCDPCNSFAPLKHFLFHAPRKCPRSIRTIWSSACRWTAAQFDRGLHPGGAYGHV